MNIENLIASKQCSIVDVRTPAEFMGGHVAGSLNIPLQQIADRLSELKSLKQPLVVCCASGNRSAQAQRYLSQQGVTCYNGGSWFDVNNFTA